MTTANFVRRSCASALLLALLAPPLITASSSHLPSSAPTTSRNLRFLLPSSGKQRRDKVATGASASGSEQQEHGAHESTGEDGEVENDRSTETTTESSNALTTLFRYMSVLPVVCKCSSERGRDAFRKAALSVRNVLGGDDKLGGGAQGSESDGSGSGGSGSGGGTKLLIISGRVPRRSLAQLNDADGIEGCEMDGEVRAVDFESESHQSGGIGNLRRERTLRAPQHRAVLEERRPLRRELEEVGDGNALIQADLLPAGPHPATVCIADSGYDLGHLDLPSSYPYVDGTDSKAHIWYEDRNGHGTHVAGIVAALENGYGVRGVGNLTLHITRALDDRGRGQESDVIAAIEQCVNAGSRIVVLALGTFQSSAFDDEYFDELYRERGILLFASAGNVNSYSHGRSFYPASYPAVVSVAACGATGERWGDGQTTSTRESMMNAQVELTALGYKVNSTYPDEKGSGYQVISGTSMSAGAAAGAAALLWSYFPDCTAYHVRNALAGTARNYYYPSSENGQGCDRKQGHGIIQVRDAYDRMVKEGCDLDGVNYLSDDKYDACSGLPPTPSPVRDNPAPRDSPRRHKKGP